MQKDVLLHFLPRRPVWRRRAAPVEYTTAAAAEEKAKLQKHFSRFDIYFFLICTIVGVDTLGQVASNGAEGLTWLLVLAVLFFVPYAFLTAELGAAFTDEGGSYVWTRLAWGRFVACINAVFYWFSNPVWIGGALVLLTHRGRQHRTSSTSARAASSGTSSAWPTSGSASGRRSSRSASASGSRRSARGAACSLLGGFTIAALIYAISNGLSLPAAGDFSPTYGLFIVLVPLLFFNYVGFELPNAAGDEMENPQSDVPVTVLRACVTAILMYGLPILAIVCVLPKSQITGVGGFMDSVKAVFTVFGGHSEVAERRYAQRHADRVRQGARLPRRVRLRARARLECMHLADGLRPLAGRRGLRRLRPALAGHVLGQVRHADQRELHLRHAVDDRVHLRLSADGDAAKIFAAMIGVVLLFTTMSYILIFPTVIKLRYSHRRTSNGRSRSPRMAGVWFCGVICTAWAVFASIVGLFPGLGNGQFLNDQDLSDAYGLSRAGYTSIAFGAIAVTFAVGVWFYIAGAKTRAEMVPSTEAVMAPPPADGTAPGAPSLAPSGD